MRGYHFSLFCLLVFVFLFQGLSPIDIFAAGPRTLMVGVAKVDVTPTEPVVLAGYGG